MRSRLHAAFSLIEVVIAVGIFAVGIVTILALLPSLIRQSSESYDTQVALGFGDSIAVELKRASGANLNALGTTIPTINASLQNGYLLAASRDGARIESIASPPNSVLPVSERYFAVEVWRPSQSDLSYSSGGALQVYVRVSWPFYSQSGAGPIALADRSVVTYMESVAP